jgi:hypothetical protein
MFIQPCFIQKCTPALIEKLVGLGYKIVGKTTLSYGIFCNNGKIKICSTNEQPSIKDKDFIQCYNNEELFLALAALRDDTNENQWFIAQRTMWDENYNGEITVYYEEGEWLLWDYYSFMEDMPSDFRKATVEEIIEHFKNK